MIVGVTVRLANEFVPNVMLFKKNCPNEAVCTESGVI